MLLIFKSASCASASGGLFFLDTGVADVGLSLALSHLPPIGEILLEDISVDFELKGEVDFLGLQVYSHAEGYLQKPFCKGDFSVKDKFKKIWLGSSIGMKPAVREKYISSLFNLMKPEVRAKLGVLIAQTHFYFFPSFKAVRDTRYGTRYRQLLYDLQGWPVYDAFDNYDSSEEIYSSGSSKMEKYSLEEFQKKSGADYFLVAAIRPLEIEKTEASNFKFISAFIIAVYSRSGDKVYSKVYYESLNSDKITLEGFNNCIGNLFENQSEQISEDLSFLLSADDGEYPTLEDLYKEMQTDKPIGRIYNDMIKYKKTAK